MDSNNSELSSASGIKEVTRKYLYEQIKEQNLPSFSENLEKLENNLLECYGHTEESKKNLKRKFSNFKAQIKQRWITVKRREDLFLTQNQAWLEGTFEIPCETIHRQGRPNKLFAESSERTKRRKTEEIRATVDDDIIDAEITGINHELIHRCKVILETISSGHKIDAAKYDAYALDTAKLYVNEYGWHPMTPTMHKVLIHGAKIIENAILPIGQLSEEAAEARNKHFRSYRQNYARKFSREACNLDICHRLLLTSDPLLSSTRTKNKRAHKTFSSEAMELLMAAEPNR